MHKKIPLTQGYFSIIDKEDYDRVSNFSWYSHVQNKGCIIYATRKSSRIYGKQKTIFLHRFILDITDEEFQIDHINHNGLDNRKNNLRIVTRSQNQGNSRKFNISKSQFKGVTWQKNNRKWQAACAHKYLGLFDSEEDAAIAYNIEALKHFGEYAYINKNIRGYYE